MSYKRKDIIDIRNIAYEDEIKRLDSHTPLNAMRNIAYAFGHTGGHLPSAYAHVSVANIRGTYIPNDVVLEQALTGFERQVGMMPSFADKLDACTYALTSTNRKMQQTGLSTLVEIAPMIAEPQNREAMADEIISAFPPERVQIGQQSADTILSRRRPEVHSAVFLFCRTELQTNTRDLPPVVVMSAAYKFAQAGHHLHDAYTSIEAAGLKTHDLDADEFIARRAAKEFNEQLGLMQSLGDKLDVCTYALSSNNNKMREAGLTTLVDIARTLSPEMRNLIEFEVRDAAGSNGTIFQEFKRQLKEPRMPPPPRAARHKISRLRFG